MVYRNEFVIDWNEKGPFFIFKTYLVLVLSSSNIANNKIMSVTNHKRLKTISFIFIDTCMKAPNK